MAKIKSLKVREEFESSHGSIDIGTPHTLRTKGYSLPAFPVGHTIPTDSDLVYVIGRNGTGKSTLLEKLGNQYRASMNAYRRFSATTKYFETEYEGAPPECEILRRWDERSREKMLREVKEQMLSQRPDVELLREDPNAVLIFDSTPCTPYLTEEQKEIMWRLNALSNGETQWTHLMGRLALAEKQGPDYVLLIDEPEASLDMVRRREFLDLIRQRYDKGLQTFLATHDADFLRRAPEGVLVLKLSEPAQVVPASEFDVDRYIEEELAVAN